MGFSPRRWRILAIVAALFTFFAYQLLTQPLITSSFKSKQIPNKYIQDDGNLHWEKIDVRYPVKEPYALPTGKPAKPIPRIQAAKPKETAEERKVREERRAKVKASFVHSWAGYKAHAWLKDEVSPVSGGHKTTFGGWAATLVDALDTLWILGMKEDFEQAVDALDELDFTFTPDLDINVFETTIRYLGGFLGAYDISDAAYPKLLTKAVEVGEFLLCAFDTPNRMPITRWPWRDYMYGTHQVAPSQVLLSELASLSLEFTRLSQLTGDMRWYDAVARIANILEYNQSRTKLPGMWPVVINPQKGMFDIDSTFTLGGMSDSAYEYLPKQYLLLGGKLEQPRGMYEAFLPVAEKHLFFSVLNKENLPLLASGDARVFSSPGSLPSLLPRMQHLTCFTGGMVALGSRIFSRPGDLETARRLTNGCVWAYSSMLTGVGPEVYDLVPCNTTLTPSCAWSDEKWMARIPSLPSDELERMAWIRDRGLVEGFTGYGDRKYILRPEAVESVWYLYRTTGEREWMDKAWRMFEQVEKHTRTAIASSAIRDVTSSRGGYTDSMESFWLAETLKYFWLMFADFDVVSLDDWVLNTEAHPLKRPT